MQNNNLYLDQTLALAMLNDECFAEKIEQFGIMLSSNDVYNLAQQLFALILEGHGQRKNPIGPEDDYPGFIELWRLAISKGSISNYDSWIFQEIKKALPKNLRFANDIFYYWGSNKLVPENNSRTQLRSNIISESKRVFCNAESLCRIIDPSYIYCLYHFVVFFSDPKHGGTGYKPEEWTWLADILLDAGQNFPSEIVPQISRLVCQSNMGRNKYIYKLDLDNTNILFSNKLTAVMNLLSQDIDISNLREEDMELVSFIQREAKSWLANPKNSS